MEKTSGRDGYDGRQRDTTTDADEGSEARRDRLIPTPHQEAMLASAYPCGGDNRNYGAMDG